MIRFSLPSRLRFDVGGRSGPPSFFFEGAPAEPALELPSTYVQVFAGFFPLFFPCTGRMLLDKVLAAHHLEALAYGTGRAVVVSFFISFRILLLP